MSAFSKLMARICDLPEGKPVSGADCAGHLDRLAKEHPDDPDWRRSIADLLKILDLDASLATSRISSTRRVRPK